MRMVNLINNISVTGKIVWKYICMVSVINGKICEMNNAIIFCNQNKLTEPCAEIRQDDQIICL